MEKYPKHLKTYLNKNGLRFQINEKRVWGYIETVFGRKRAEELSQIFDETYVTEDKSIEVNKKYKFCSNCSSFIFVIKKSAAEIEFKDTFDNFIALPINSLRILIISFNALLSSLLLNQPSFAAFFRRVDKEYSKSRAISGREGYFTPLYLYHL